MYAGTLHKHSNAQVTIENDKECVKSVGKVNHPEVKLSHLYMGVCENNRFREMWRMIRRRLEDTCMVSDARGHAPVE